MRLPRRSRRNIAQSERTLVTLHAELGLARSEIDRLRRERKRLVAQQNSIMAERDEAIRERDRAVAELYRETADHGPGAVSDFSGYVVVPRWRPLDYPSLVIETEASDEDVSRMCEDLAASWSAMGEREPFFTNVAHDKFAMNNIAENEEEFFQSGFESLSHIAAIAHRQGIDIDAYRDCFELGCGVGRITRALADVFDSVWGMDVSASHLRAARKSLADVAACVELRQFDGLASLDTLPHFDLFVSFSVLQHNPPPLAAKILDKVLSKVRPGGAACFQCQTYQTDYRFRVAEYLQGGSERHDYQQGPFGWEMHCLPQAVIYETFRRNGFSLLEVRENGGLASGVSQVFFAVREPKGPQVFGTNSGRS